MLINLNGKWSFRKVGEDKWYEGKVPGSNYLDLLENNLIEDPFYGLNEQKAQLVANYDYEYKKTFNLSKNDIEKDLVLSFECLDTIADIYLNNTLIASTKNAHIEYNFNISKNVLEGENELKIYFHSPIKYVNEKQSILRIPQNVSGIAACPHIRKPQYHFGWDWGPVLPPSGISGNVYIKEKKKAEISDMNIKQIHKDNKVTLNIEIETTNNIENADIELSLTSPEGKVETFIQPLDKHMFFSVDILNPKLWWTAELSKKTKQPLYTVKAIIKNKNNFEPEVKNNITNAPIETIKSNVHEINHTDKLAKNSDLNSFENTSETHFDVMQKRIGLRTIVLNRDKDCYGQNFQFLLNGVPIFAKGANWIPADSFATRVTKEKLEWYIKTAINSNFNIIRVWGGGFYGGEDFYNLCDTYGLLVWQDFMYACRPYPFFFEDFLDNAMSEAEFIVKKIRHHASLALLCGNNEIELLSLAYKNKRDFIKWTEIFFYEKLKDIVSRLCPYVSYIEGTPIGHKYNKGLSADNVGNTHLWAVWHGLKPASYYRKRLTRFCSEFGFESLPDIKTIHSFATEKDFSLTSEVFNNHQKNKGGNMKIAYYIASRFRLPKNFIDYIYLSNICQLECVQDATEHWRRNKGRCNGSIYWQFNDCWPVVSWSSVDYFGNYKALQYGAKNFFAPQMVSIENHKKHLDIYVINDLIEKLNAKIECTLYDFDGNMLTRIVEDVSISESSSKKVKTISLKEFKSFNLSKSVFVVKLLKNDEVLSCRTYLFKKEKALNLPKANISISIEIEDNMAKYVLKTDKFARLVCLSSKTNNNPFSDNYFDLIPGEEKVIYQKLDKTYTVSSLEKEISAFSLSDVVPKQSKLKDFILRCKVFLSPINFGSWLYYTMMKKKVNLKTKKQ